MPILVNLTEAVRILKHHFSLIFGILTRTLPSRAKHCLWNNMAQKVFLEGSNEYGCINLGMKNVHSYRHELCLFSFFQGQRIGLRPLQLLVAVHLNSLKHTSTYIGLKTTTK